MTNDHPWSVLVLILGRDPLPVTVAEAALIWETAGAKLSVITLTPRARLTVTARQVTLLGRPVGADGIDPSTAGVPRSAPRKILRRLHLDPVRWLAALLVLASPRASQLVGRANVVLAADPASIPLAWVLARRRGENTVFRSVSAASRALDSGAPD
jgi:hypothetical protein